MTKTIKHRSIPANALPDQEKRNLWETFYKDRDDLQCVYQKQPDVDLDRCYKCHQSTVVIMEDGFPTCSNPDCSIIYRETLDYSPEWRFYGSDDKNGVDPTRCGQPTNPLLQESTFGCKVMSSYKSSYEMKKISKWAEWQAMPHHEKALLDDFQFISVMAHREGIPKRFVEDAMRIHKQLRGQKMLRGLNRDGLKAASIYVACRMNGCPRTPYEISEIFKLDRTSATTGCSTALQLLTTLERDNETENQIHLETTTPSMLLDRHCSKLNFPENMTKLCQFIANKIEKNELIQDNTPISIVAGIMYFVAFYCRLPITKVEVKNACGVSEVTITKCFKKLETIRGQLIPASFIGPV